MKVSCHVLCQWRLESPFSGCLIWTLESVYVVMSAMPCLYLYYVVFLWPLLPLGLVQHLLLWLYVPQTSGCTKVHFLLVLGRPLDSCTAVNHLSCCSLFYLLTKMYSARHNTQLSDTSLDICGHMSLEMLWNLLYAKKEPKAVTNVVSSLVSWDNGI